MSRLLRGNPSARMLDAKAERRGGDTSRKSPSSGDGARDSAIEHLRTKARVLPGDTPRESLRHARDAFSRPD